MTGPRRSRQLSAEERKLWAHVARGIKPFSGRAVPEAPEAEIFEPDEPSPAKLDPGGRVNAVLVKPVIPPLAPLEHKMLVGLRRGTRRVDAVLDLHGMRQGEAHRALIGFVRRSVASGRLVILVITGKGAVGASDSVFEERGVLRRVVPHWLRLPELRPFVVGFEQAAPHHGGSGALYVRLRKGHGGRS